MLPILLMQMLVQNKLFLAVVPLQRLPAHIALGQLYQHNPLRGPGLASRTPHHHRIQNLNSDTVMYSCTLGRIQTTTTKQSRTQVSWDSSRVVASLSVLVLTHPQLLPLPPARPTPGIQEQPRPLPWPPAPHSRAVGSKNFSKNNCEATALVYRFYSFP